MSESTNSLSSFSSHTYHIPPAYSFSKSRREPIKKSIPGPGDYSPSPRYWSPAYSISKGRRQLSNYRDISPGPGFYNYSSSSSQYRYSISKALNKSFTGSQIVRYK